MSIRLVVYYLYKDGCPCRRLCSQCFSAIESNRDQEPSRDPQVMFERPENIANACEQCGEGYAYFDSSSYETELKPPKIVTISLPFEH